ncbi:hypothetical protein [Streptomyces sp. NPDC005017]|uniref:hypothetical protein n=1 Tax=Streptomyces sp. NPDC005017 TaxID=3364706 RepID=UPI003685DE20
MAGAAVGIGSLVFTGVATYYGARIAQQQLEQSRSQEEDSARSQAARVAYWVEETQGPTLVHLTNQSPGPITDVRIEFYWAVLKERPGERSVYERVSFAVPLESMAPCTEVTLNARDMKRLSDRGLPIKLEHVGLSLTVQYASFRDDSGAYWIRDADGLTRAKSKGEALLTSPSVPPAPAGAALREWGGSIPSRPVEKLARACEATATAGI